jgi:hypothetical protein
MTMALKSAAGAAVLLILSAHITAAGPDGTCEEETTASVTTESYTTAMAGYVRLAETAPTSASATSAAPEAADTRLRDKKGDSEKKQTDRLPNERQSSDSADASVFQPNADNY